MLNPEDRLTERERVLALREKRVAMMLALVEATQEQLERRLEELDAREARELASFELERFDREKYLAEPASSYLLLATGALERERAPRRDLSSALLGAVKQTSNAVGADADEAVELEARAGTAAGY